MYTDEQLRKEIKLLKALDRLDTYAECAEMARMSVNSFYNWLNGAYNLGAEKKKLLSDIISDLAPIE